MTHYAKYYLVSIEALFIFYLFIVLHCAPGFIMHFFLEFFSGQSPRFKF